VNVGMSGDFSANVLQEALDKVWSLKAGDTRAPELRAAIANPVSEEGFLCHLEDHWIALRKLEDGSWWNLDSLQEAPQFLSDLYLGVFLKQLQLEGWTIYVVRGVFPTPPLNRSAQYWRFVQAGTAAEKRAHHKTEEEIFDEEMKAAILASMQDNGNPTNTQNPTNTTTTTTTTTANTTNSTTQHHQHANIGDLDEMNEMDEMDEDLKLAIALSKQDSFPT